MNGQARKVEDQTGHRGAIKTDRGFCLSDLFSPLRDGKAAPEHFAILLLFPHHKRDKSQLGDKHWERGQADLVKNIKNAQPRGQLVNGDTLRAN
jgi:hypothetical protein